MLGTGKTIPVPSRHRSLFVKVDQTLPSDQGTTTDHNSRVRTLEHHRSRERIKAMGEVFTPERYVHEMLALFDETVWSDESVVFFEPACGHGNIALAIVERRINSLAAKYATSRIDQPFLHAVATTIHTLWAVDICPVNVQLTRKRIVDMVVQRLQTTDFEIRRPELTDYIIHILCALIWQVHENETLSALSQQSAAQTKAARTKLGQCWIKANGHKPINFNVPWCEFYERSRARSAVPLLFEKAARFLKSSISIGGANRPGFENFNFARDAVQLLIEKHRRQPAQPEAV